MSETPFNININLTKPDFRPAARLALEEAAILLYDAGVSKPPLKHTASRLRGASLGLAESAVGAVQIGVTNIEVLGLFALSSARSLLGVFSKPPKEAARLRGLPNKKEKRNLARRRANDEWLRSYGIDNPDLIYEGQRKRKEYLEKLPQNT